jgi:thiol-disulfide isomerase/thioredoxin
MEEARKSDARVRAGGPFRQDLAPQESGRPRLLINVWATWCGPCQAELPKLEKLYEKVKDRSDLQILTLTIDEDLGAVAPFMKEKGYTFPVLPAYSFVTGLLDWWAYRRTG